MNWKWANRKDDIYPSSVGRYEQRIAALEADMRELSEDLLSYINADMDCGWMAPAKRLATTLHKIIDSQAK